MVVPFNFSTWNFYRLLYIFTTDRLEYEVSHFTVIIDSVSVCLVG